MLVNRRIVDAIGSFVSSEMASKLLHGDEIP
jgi:hypothetical protein